MDSIYPRDIERRLRDRWRELSLPDSHLPDRETLTTLLDVAYQTSLLQEEGRHITARIAILNRASLKSPSQTLVLKFALPLPLTPQNVRKLAAAVSYYRSLLAVCIEESGEWIIWGMLTTGTDWINHIEGTGRDTDTLPRRPIVHAAAPGHLLVSYGSRRVIESNGGAALENAFDPFRSKWLPSRFASVRESILQGLSDEYVNGSPRVCESFVKDVAQSVVRRTLRLVRTRRHGGLLVYLPHGEDGDQIADEWFRYRVRFAGQDEVQRFRSLMLQLITRAHQVGKAAGLQVVTYNDYLEMHDPELAAIDRNLIEFGHLLADLMDVDGALVLDRSFRLIGFGAEILGDSHVSIVHRSADLEATQLVEEPADSAGTRHRAAYRLVSGVSDAIVVVVSQDGDVRFVAQHQEKTTYWPYLP